jgi:hypothetical protein
VTQQDTDWCGCGIDAGGCGCGIDDESLTLCACGAVTLGLRGEVDHDVIGVL